MSTSPIFLVGVGRSGTTLLRQMINSHSQIAVPYESHFITKYEPIIRNLGSNPSVFERKKVINDICSESILEYWDFKPTAEALEANIESFTPAHIFDKFYMAYANHHGKKMWGDKSAYLDNLYEVKRIFPDAKFIHIVRDGRDVANSLKKVPFGPKTISDAADFWARYVKLGMSMGRMLDKSQYMELRYEDLVIDSETELKKICNFIGVDFEPKMLDFYKDSKKFIPQKLLSTHTNTDQPPMATRVYSWKNNMTQVEVDIFSKMAREMLAEFKYEVPEVKSSNIKIKLKKFKDLLFKSNKVRK